MLEDYARQLPLRWQQHPINLGFDRNCASVVSMARGRYCWLLGSDDCITEGALAQIMLLLRQHDPDIFHFGYVQADINLFQISRSAPPMLSSAFPMTPLEQSKHLSTLPNVSLLFAFISSFIFRRQSWIDHQDRLPGWVGSHYVHTFMLHAMLSAGATILSTSECFVIARGGNQNEINSTIGKFVYLDSTTLQRINKEIYNNSPDHLVAFGEVFRRSYPFRSILFIAANGGISQLISCQSQLIELGYSKIILKMFEFANKLGLMPTIKHLIKLRNKFLILTDKFY
jgi:abequosyltransferase